MDFLWPYMLRRREKRAIKTVKNSSFYGHYRGLEGDMSLATLMAF